MVTDTYDDEYFAQRGLEPKHFLEVGRWVEALKPESLLVAGCGLGHRVYAAHTLNIDAYGFDFSPTAILKMPYPMLKDRIKHGNVLEIPFDQTFDLVVAYDILEHLENPKDVPFALQQLERVTAKHCLFSIPFLGDPNLEKDHTHHVKRSKGWWQYQISKYFTLIEVPDSFPFRHQLLLGVKK